MVKIQLWVAAFLAVLPMERANSQEAPDCTAAATAIAAITVPDILADSAVSFRRLFGCPISGPAQIARIWMRPSLTQREANELLQGSRYMLDTRILFSLTTVARDASRPSYLRQSAAVASLPYVVRGIATNIDMLRRTARTQATAPFYSGEADIVNGSNPPNANATSSVAQLMMTLATQTADPVLQDIGIAGLAAVHVAAPDAVVIPTSAITLTYMCGNKFRFRSRLFLNLTTRYEVYGTTDTGTGTASMPDPGTSQREVFFTTRLSGTVRLFHQGQLLATKANGGTQCPRPSGP